MKKVIKRPSAIPLYGAAAVWLVWCLLLPLYRLWHFAALIAVLTEKIFADIVEDPNDVPQVKRFAGYYLPTTMKLLNAYDRMSGEGSGQNVSGTLRRIEDILDTTVQAYRKEYDSLFANEALDIETDITVLESMLKREGLAGKDF